jgi:ABC-type nitrate/sulfonate/bicarbonate transport system substrate-binding protein
MQRFLIKPVLALLLCLAGGVQAAPDLPVLPITVFAAPSHSVWLPTIIQKTGLDKKHGFELQVKQKPGQVAYAEFAAGIDKVCFCAAPAAVARFVEQGADITLLWNVFNLEYVVIANDPAIRSAADLAGRTIAADTGTGGWAVAAMLLRQQGLDLSKAKIQSSWGAAQVAQLAAGRVDALVTGPVEAALLAAANPDRKFQQFTITDPAAFRQVSSSPGIPSIAMGAWRDWLAVPQNDLLVRKLYLALQDAVAFVHANPERAAELISSTVDVRRESVLLTLQNYPQLINVGPIGPYEPAIRLLTQKWLPEAKLLDRPMTEAELASFVASFRL